MKWLLLMAAALAACGKTADEGPPCAKVMDHVLDLMKSTQGGHGGMNLGSRDAMIASCEQRHMPKEVRYCLINSKDITGMANCSRMSNVRGGEPPPMRAPMGGSAMPTPTPPPTTPTPTPAAGSGTQAP
ncbi:MAG TPA: hypothetical protein VGL61_01050 [Kofleriaceae bacterium]|jgi:hypothetical protein